MASAKRRSHKSHAAGRAEAPERKATTFRLEPGLRSDLAVLGHALNKPLNKLVNEAVQSFIVRRAAEVGADMERTLERLKACQKHDPGFEAAIAQFADAEASLGHADPVEGKPSSAAGPAQTMVRDLLRG